MERQAAQLRRLNAQILERLRLRINHLIDVFALNLIRRYGVPPESLVEDIGNRFQDALWYVDMSSSLDDLAIHELGYLGHGVVRGPEELVGLRGGSVVLEHGFESGADIDGLEMVSE